jgi:hypothetical protein
MEKKGFINAFLSLGLAGFFYLFFMTTKHDAALSPIIPFALDPYDAIGSFAVETAVFLALLSVVRTIRLARLERPDVMSVVFLARTHMGVVLAVLLTLVGDAIAMLRHWSSWTGRPATMELVLWLVGMMILGSLVGISVSFAARTISVPDKPWEWKRASLGAVAMIAILAFYPEQLIHNNVGELFTVVVGALLLFVPLWAWGKALLPSPEPRPAKKRENSQVRSRLVQGMVVILLSIGVGLVLVLGESTESGGGGRGIQVFHALHVIGVYVGLEVAAVLIGYGLLKNHLGLFRSTGTVGEGSQGNR